MTDAASARTRRRRTWIAFIVLAAGTTAFWWSFDLVAVELHRMTAQTRTATGTRTNWVGGPFIGWECALRYRPAWPANVGLAVAPALWLCALWFRSTWALTIGAACCMLGAAVQAMCAFTGAAEGVTEFRSGYWVWLASSIAMTVAFALLPAPERPPPGESLPPEVVIAARTRFALAFAALGTVFAGTSLFAFGGVRGSPLAVIARDSAAVPENLTPSTLTLALERPASGAVAFALLGLPVFFAAAWLLRSTLVRVCGATLAAATVAAQPFVPRDGFWMSWFSSVPPGVVHWFASPAALLVALLLLPTGRRRD